MWKRNVIGRQHMGTIEIYLQQISFFSFFQKEIFESFQCYKDFDYLDLELGKYKCRLWNTAVKSSIKENKLKYIFDCCNIIMAIKWPTTIFNRSVMHVEIFEFSAVRVQGHLAEKAWQLRPNPRWFCWRKAKLSASDLKRYLGILFWSILEY